MAGEGSGNARPVEVARPGGRLHPLPVRIMHWINAAVMMVMIKFGWGIYDDDVIVHGLHFSGFLRLGGLEPHWHFAGMWFFGINGLFFLVDGLTTRRLRGLLWPIRPRDLVHTVVDTRHFKIAMTI
jgi:thiosulfate reductase cytochrome b subunit